MRDGARVQLRGDTAGGSVWATATADFENRGPKSYNGVNGRWPVDDGLYCVVKAVFAPTNPDPNGSYSIKFVGGDWHSWVRVRSEFWMYEPLEDNPGYGSFVTTYQACKNLWDPPDRDCSVWGN